MNPLMMLIQAIRGGGNLMETLSQMSGNPTVARGMQMIEGRSNAELEQLARNMAKEHGTTPEAIFESIMKGMQ